MSKDSPFYVEHGSLKNQGVYSGDGNKYRFGFDVWSGECIPDGVEEDAEKIYYCFSIGAKAKDKNNCVWINKEVFEDVLFQGHGGFSIYKHISGNYLIFCNDPEELVGIIMPDYLWGDMGLWGVALEPSLGQDLSFTNVFEKTTVEAYRARRDSYLSLVGGKEEKAILYTGVFNANTDSVESVVREENLVFSESVFKRSSTFTIIPTYSSENSSQITSLKIGLPQTFYVTDRRIKVHTAPTEITSPFAGLPDVTDKENPEGLVAILQPKFDIESDVETQFFTPQGVSEINSDIARAVQYSSIVVGRDTFEKLGGEELYTRNLHVYEHDFFLSLLDGEALTIYVEVLATEEIENEGSWFDSKKTVFSGTMKHTYDGVPDNGENTINVPVCSVRLWAYVDGAGNNVEEYYVVPTRDYGLSLSSNAILLRSDKRETEVEDPEDIELEHVTEVPGEEVFKIDLNDPQYHDNVQLLIKTTGTSGKEYSLPVNFVNARYYSSGGNTSMGVVRVADIDPLKLRVGLAGLAAPPGLLTKNHVYGYSSANKWGLFEFEDVELVNPEGGGAPRYQLKFIKDAEDMETAFYDERLPEPKWVKNSTMLWYKHLPEENIGGNLVLDYTEYPTRHWDMPMPGIVMLHPSTGTPAGLFMNIEHNGGPRIDMGWGGSNGGNFELYATEHAERSGQFRIIVGPNGFVEFKKYVSGETWKTIAGITKEGRFFCGFNDTGFPGTTEASIAKNADDAPQHPFQVYDESTTPKIVGFITKDGAISLARPTGSTTPSDPIENAIVIWQDIDTHDIGVKVHDGTEVLSFKIVPYVPDTLTDGDTLVYDEASGTFVNGSVLPDGTNEGDVLVWTLDGDPPIGSWEPAANEGSLPDGTTDGDLMMWDSANSVWVPTRTVEKEIVTHIVFENGALTMTKEKVRVIEFQNSAVHSDLFETVEGAGAVSIETTLGHTHL